MKIFVAASYSSQVNYDTGEVHSAYKDWLEEVLGKLENAGHTVFCALRADQYKINDEDPAAAFSLDLKHITESDALLALLSEKVSAGVQTEIGVAVALGKKVFIAHESTDELAYFNAAMIKAGVATEVNLPLDDQQISKIVS